MAHTLDNHNDSLSEGGALAAVVSVLPGKPYWKRVGTDSPRLMRPSEASMRLARPPSPGEAARRTRGKLVVGATPNFRPLMRHGAGAGYSCLYSSFCLPLGVAPTTVIPGGKAVEPMRKPRASHRPQAEHYPRETPTEAATTQTRCGSKWVPSRNIALAKPFSTRSYSRTPLVFGRQAAQSEPPAMCQVVPEGHTSVSFPCWQSVF